MPDGDKTSSESHSYKSKTIRGRGQVSYTCSFLASTKTAAVARTILWPSIGPLPSSQFIVVCIFGSVLASYFHHNQEAYHPLCLIVAFLDLTSMWIKLCFTACVGHVPSLLLRSVLQRHEEVRTALHRDVATCPRHRRHNPFYHWVIRDSTLAGRLAFLN